jgi:hypothetical protein
MNNTIIQFFINKKAQLKKKEAEKNRELLQRSEKTKSLKDEVGSNPNY